jgi:pimeloyl-ACP methyl ester carboxylesterase
MNTFKEQALLFGSQKSLVGVITESRASNASADRPTIVMLNSGIIHRVGANRMTVTLSRALAAEGYTVVRFDLSGIGDSEPRRDGLAPLDASLADIKEVLDALEATRQTRRVVLMGLCSGADQSVIYAGSDSRVVGAVLLDPSIPRTRLFYWHHYKIRMTDLLRGLNKSRGWRRLLGAVNRRLLRGPTTPPQAPAYGQDLDSPDIRSFLERAYQGAMDREVELLAVFTGGRVSKQSYREQLLHAFPRVSFSGRIRLEYFKNSDHIFSAERDRARLTETILDWTRGTTFRRESAAARSCD